MRGAAGPCALLQALGLFYYSERQGQMTCSRRKPPRVAAAGVWAECRTLWRATDRDIIPAATADRTENVVQAVPRACMGEPMTADLLSDVLGWIGAGLLLGAYALVSTRKLEGDSIAYQALNLLGSAFLIVNSFHYGAYPSVGVNVVWIGIALFAIVRTILRARGRR